MKPNILFDLDGTLTESGTGIKNSVRYMLAHYGLPPRTDEELNAFVGPPLAYSFHHFCGFSPEKAKEAIAVYRTYYTQKGMFENRPYPGVPELLAALQGAGARLYVATGKPEPYARAILERFGLLPFFSGVAGISLREEPCTKAELITRLLTAGGFAPGQAVMVGDRRYDVEGALATGLTAVGVLYGYGTKEELTAAGAHRLAETVPALQRLLLGQSKEEDHAHF